MDPEAISDRLSQQIAKLVDRYDVIPPLPPKFWIELRYLIRDDLKRALGQSASNKED